jgi:hypothetical protein
MSDSGDMDLPAELIFKPSKPDSRACSFGLHTPIWSSTLVKGTKHLVAITHNGKYEVPAVFQIGRCERCGIVMKREP